MTLDLSGLKITFDYLHVQKLLATIATDSTYIVTPRIRNKSYYISNPLWTQTALQGIDLVSARHGEAGDESRIYELRNIDGQPIAYYNIINEPHLNPVLVDDMKVGNDMLAAIFNSIGTIKVNIKDGEQEVVNMIAEADQNEWDARDWKTVKKVYNNYGVELKIPSTLNIEGEYSWSNV